MSYVGTLTKFATYHVGSSFFAYNHSSETGLGRLNQLRALVKGKLSSVNLSLPSNVAVKSQTLRYNLLEKICSLLSAKKDECQSGKNLPPEIWLMIVPFLRTEDIKNLRCVSKTLHQIATPYIRCIEVVNAAELPGALSLLQKTGPDTTMLRLAKGGFARNVSRIKAYPSLTDRNIKTALDKAELEINRKNEEIILQEQPDLNLKENASLPIKNLQLYQIDLRQAEIILPNEITFGSAAFSSKWEKAKSLELKECQLSMSTLIKILKVMPNLRGFGLYACTGLNDLSMANLDTGFLGNALLRMSALAVHRLFLNELVLENLASSSNLEEIRLMGSDISTYFLRLLLKNKPNLRYLEISSCHLINDDVFLSIYTPNLVSLKLFNCRLSDSFLSTLFKNSPNLKNLELVSCVGLTSLAFFNLSSRKLNALRLVRCKISDMAFNEMIKNQHKLRSLEVNSCVGLTRSAFFALSKLKLFSLKISKCEISDTYLYLMLENQPALKSLEIDMDAGLSDLSISFLKNLELNYLRINGGAFHESACQNITQIISGLQALHLNRCEGLNTKIFSDAMPLKKLKIFKMELCRIPDVSFETVMQAMPELEGVHFRKIYFLMAKGFSIEFKLEKVKILTLESSQLSNHFFRKIIDMMPNLKELRLSKSYGLTDKALLEIKRLRKLEVLDISGCKFSKKTLNVIKEHVGKVINKS